MKTAIDFPTPVKKMKQPGRLSESVFVDAPEFCRSEYWFVRIAYRVESALLFFDCETDRYFGVDVVFGPSRRKRRYTHSYLSRLFDSPVASGLGSSLPKDQHDMDDCFGFILSARESTGRRYFVRRKRVSLRWRRAFIERDFANSAISPRRASSDEKERAQP